MEGEDQKQLADRYNSGKNRIGLVPTELTKEVGKVMSYGASKYSSDNWRKGLPWMGVIDSLERHLLAFKEGEDIDPESGLLHLGHMGCNIAFLLNYMKTHPELDDRPHTKRDLPKIGCDLDDCIISWIKPWCEKFGHDIPEDWYFSYNTYENFKTLEGNQLNDFYSNLPAKVKPSEIPFDINCYITARTIDENITKTWIEKNGFPTKPVYTVGFGQSKVQAAKDAQIDWFIDDNYATYLEMNKAGITCFLMTNKHNERYNVGYKRISSFQDLKERFL